MGAPRQHIRREVRIGVRLPANHDEIAGEVSGTASEIYNEQNPRNCKWRAARGAANFNVSTQGSIRKPRKPFLATPYRPATTSRRARLDNSGSPA